MQARIRTPTVPLLFQCHHPFLLWAGHMLRGYLSRVSFQSAWQLIRMCVRGSVTDISSKLRAFAKCCALCSRPSDLIPVGFLSCSEGDCAERVCACMCRVCDRQEPALCVGVLAGCVPACHVRACGREVRPEQATSGFLLSIPRMLAEQEQRVSGRWYGFSLLPAALLCPFLQPSLAAVSGSWLLRA